MKVIHDMRFFLIKNLLLSLVILAGCQGVDSNVIPEKITLISPSGEKILTRLAYTEAQQSQGLSGIQDQDFQNNEAMIFINNTDEVRSFWMPDTYFNLDIFYLNEELKIIDVVRNIQHHIGRDNFQDIPRAKPVMCRHVLELKAISPISKNLKIGDTLKVEDYSLQQILLNIRQQK